MVPVYIISFLRPFLRLAFGSFGVSRFAFQKHNTESITNPSISLQQYHPASRLAPPRSQDGNTDTSALPSQAQNTPWPSLCHSLSSEKQGSFWQKHFVLSNQTAEGRVAERQQSVCCAPAAIGFSCSINCTGGPNTHLSRGCFPQPDGGRVGAER